MAENVCCPNLNVIDCAETGDHKHLYCDYFHTVKGVVMNKNWINLFCLGGEWFGRCPYYPKGDGK